MIRIAILFLADFCLHLTGGVDAQICSGEGHVAMKAITARVIFYLQEEFELCKVKNNCLLFMSSIALGGAKNPMQNKRFRKIEVTKKANEMLVYVYGFVTCPITILRGRIAAVKIVLLTDKKITSAIVWVGNRYHQIVRST